MKQVSGPTFYRVEMLEITYFFKYVENMLYFDNFVVFWKFGFKGINFRFTNSYYIFCYVKRTYYT